MENDEPCKSHVRLARLSGPMQRICSRGISFLTHGAKIEINESRISGEIDESENSQDNCIKKFRASCGAGRRLASESTGRQNFIPEHGPTRPIPDRRS